MTFASDTVRTLFHMLPTETQVQYSDWEAKLAKKQRRLHIDAVMSHDNCLEVVVRIAEDFRLTAAVATDGSTGGQG